MKQRGDTQQVLQAVTGEDTATEKQVEVLSNGR